eukprot:scaffold188738_cov16-Tisochrysis_lutea.AAC.1
MAVVASLPRHAQGGRNKRRADAYLYSLVRTNVGREIVCRAHGCGGLTTNAYSRRQEERVR